MRRILALCEALYFIFFLRIVSNMKMQLGLAHITKVETDSEGWSHLHKVTRGNRDFKAVLCDYEVLVSFLCYLTSEKGDYVNVFNPANI